jgi:hypothetical protein
LYSQQDVALPVSALRDVHHILVHDDCNTSKNVHVHFNTEFRYYVWIVDTEQYIVWDRITLLLTMHYFV